MKLGSFLIILFYPIYGTAQTKQPTAKDVVNAINHPQWSVKVHGEISDGEIFKVREEVLTLSLYNNEFENGDTYDFYINNNTGKLLDTITTNYLTCYGYENDTVIYYAKADSIFKFDRNTLKRKFFAVIPGHSLHFITMRDNMLYVHCRENRFHPLLTVSLKTGIITKLASNIPGDIQGIYGNTLILHYNNYTFGFDLQTFKTLWKIDNTQHYYSPSGYCNKKTKIYWWGTITTPGKLDTTFRYRPNCCCTNASPQIELTAAEESDVTSFINNEGVWVNGDSVFFSRGVSHLNNKYEYLNVAIDIHTGKTLKEKENKYEPYHPSPCHKEVSAIDSVTEPGKIYLVNNIDTSANRWKYDITSYWKQENVRNTLKSFGCYYFTNEIKDSGKMYLTMGNNIWCFDSKTGLLLWQKKIKGTTPISEVYFKGIFILLFGPGGFGARRVTVINKNNPDDMATKRVHFDYIEANNYPATIYVLTENHRAEKIVIPK
jgi:hypothetical protein